MPEQSQAQLSPWLYTPIPRRSSPRCVREHRAPCWHPELLLTLQRRRTQLRRLGHRDRRSPRLPASKFSCALGSTSRLDPVCCGRNRPVLEEHKGEGQ